MKKVTGFNYIILAICAFLGLMMEAVLAYGMEPIIYGAQISEWSNIQCIIHWIAICIIWGVISYLIIHLAKSKYDFDLWTKGSKMRRWQWLLVFILMIGSLTISYINWNGFKVILEFQRLGCVKFVFQYIYYVFEILLVTLILIFGQKACEKWFKKENIPYGGIVIAITWGMGHFLTKDFITGILCMVLGLAFGSVYLLVNRDIRKAYLVLWIMFVL